MKKFLFVILFLFVGFVGFAQSASLNWSPVEPTASANVSGYYVHWGTETGVYPERMDVGNVVKVSEIVNAFSLKSGVTYYFVVSAYNEIGEGLISNVVDYDTPIAFTVPGKVTTITITVE